MLPNLLFIICMKRIFLILSVSIGLLTSCTLTKHIKTASTKEVELNVTADLEIAQTKIRYKYVFYGGNLSVAKENAINEALKMHGDADILVSPQYEINYINHITEIIVSGFPAKYKNLRSISTDGTVFRTTKESLTEGSVISIPTEKPKLAISVKKENKEKKERPENTNNSTKEGLEPQPSIQEQYNLGISYLNTNNFKEAEKHLKQAAELGHKEAQYELGSLYLREEYIGKAKKWLKKAADQGHKEAKELLKNL